VWVAARPRWCAAYWRARQEFTVGPIANTHGGFGALLPWARAPLAAAGAHIESELFEAFTIPDCRICLPPRGAHHDEAQNLTVGARRAARFVQRQHGPDLLLQTILIGQFELRTTLARPSCGSSRSA
jgi:hypothetical protein